MKRLWLLALMLIIISVTALAEDGLVPVTGTEADRLAHEALESSFSLAASNDELALYLQEDLEGVAVEDKGGGHVWFSSAQPWQLQGGKKPNKVWSANIQSLFQLVYAMAENATGDTLIGSAVGMEHVVTSQAIPDGVALCYSFPEIDIDLRLEFVLDGRAMDVRIPQEGVREGTSYYLMAVNLLPFFGATVDTDDGYYLYPNGCGELYRFKEKKYRQNALRTYTIPVYAPLLMEEQTYPFDETELMLTMSRQNDNSAMLPVYGVKAGDSAFCAIIRQGDADAEIFVSPSGVSVDLNRMYTRFTYRKSYGVKGSSVSVAGGSSTSYLAVLIDREQRTGDRVQRYVFLHGEEADYSGMACAARETLMADGRLQDLRTDMPGVALDITMSAICRQLLFDEYVVMADFDDAASFVEELAQAGVAPVITLKGWTAEGTAGYPTGNAASRALDGASALARLAERCEQADIPLLTEVNLFRMKSDTGGFDVNQEAARDGNRFVYHLTKNEVDYYLMHPDTAMMRVDALNRRMADAGVDGVAYLDAGETIYDAYGESLRTRQGMTEAWQEMLASSREELGWCAAEGGNMYLLGQADLVRSIPNDSDRFYFGDESVPFWQMVVHGCVAYTGQPMNLYYDETLQRLKDIEYGNTPCFELTKASVTALKDTDYSLLFSARWDSWHEKLIGIAGEQDGSLAQLRHAHILRHDVLSDTLRRVTYDNGAAVYVNYGSEAAQADGLTVAGQSYLVVEGACGHE